MSAKVSVIVYIIICLEVGVLLALLPWTDFWEENYFLALLQTKFHVAWLAGFLRSGYFKGAISALGVLNILAGLRDIFKFRASVNQLSDWESTSSEQNS